MRLRPGVRVPVTELHDVSGRRIDLAARTQPTHLQFRRFAGCPVCNLHLRSFVARREEVEAAVDEVILFHSSSEDLAAYQGDVPFALVADPRQAIYRAFGVEASRRALLDPRAWPAIAMGVAAELPAVMAGRKPMPPLRPPGGRFGLPADFLVAGDGTLIAAKYGDHADDQWEVDEVLRLAARA